MHSHRLANKFCIQANACQFMRKSMRGEIFEVPLLPLQQQGRKPNYYSINIHHSRRFVPNVTRSQVIDIQHLNTLSSETGKTPIFGVFPCYPFPLPPNPKQAQAMPSMFFPTTKKPAFEGWHWQKKAVFTAYFILCFLIGNNELKSSQCRNWNI